MFYGWEGVHGNVSGLSTYGIRPTEGRWAPCLQPYNGYWQQDEVICIHDADMPFAYVLHYQNHSPSVFQ